MCGQYLLFTWIQLLKIDYRGKLVKNVKGLYYRIFLTLKFKGSDPCKFYLGLVIQKIYGNKLGFLKFNIS